MKSLGSMKQSNLSILAVPNPIKFKTIKQVVVNKT